MSEDANDPGGLAKGPGRNQYALISELVDCLRDLSDVREGAASAAGAGGEIPSVAVCRQIPQYLHAGPPFLLAVSPPRGPQSISVLAASRKMSVRRLRKNRRAPLAGTHAVRRPADRGLMNSTPANSLDETSDRLVPSTKRRKSPILSIASNRCASPTPLASRGGFSAEFRPLR
jgi:hypothetical protein